MYICFALCLYGFPAWGVGWPLDVLNDPFHAHDTLPSVYFRSTRMYNFGINHFFLILDLAAELRSKARYLNY
jgi:hypothetical protein